MYVGTLNGARDGSAVLLSRVRSATSGQLPTPPPDVVFPGNPVAPPSSGGQIWNPAPLPPEQQAKLDMLRNGPRPMLGVMPPSESFLGTPTAGIGGPVGAPIGGPVGAPVGNSMITGSHSGNPVPIIRFDGTVGTG